MTSKDEETAPRADRTRIHPSRARVTRKNLVRFGLPLLLAIVVALVASRFLKTDPGDSLRAQIRKADRYTASDDHVAALLVLERIHQRRPESPEVAERLAECRWRTGDVAGATDLIDSLLEVHPDRGRTHALLAGILLAEHDPERARAEALVALACGHDDAGVRFVAGVSSLEMGLEAEALEHFRIVREIDAKNAHARMFLAGLEGGHASRKLLEQAATGEGISRTDYAFALGLSGDAKKARRTAELSVAEQPGDLRALAVLLSLVPAEEEEVARAAVKRAIESQAGPAAVLLHAGWLARTGRIEKALELIEERADAEAVVARVNILLLAARYEEVLALLPAAGTEERDARSEVVRIQALAGLGRRAEALATLTTLVADHPGRPDLLLASVPALVRSLEAGAAAEPEAASRLEELLASVSSAETVLIAARARTDLLRGRPEDAEQRLDVLSGRAATHVSVRSARLRLLLHLGDHRGAMALLKESAGPSDRGELLSLARFALRTGAPQTTLDLAGKVGPGATEAEWIRLRVRALLRLSRGADALTLLEETDDPALLVTRASVLYSVDRTEEAEALALRASQTEGHAAEALALRAFWAIADGESEEAESLLFGDDLPEEAGRRALSLLATRLSTAGRNDASTDWLRKGRERWPADPEFLGRLALSELRKGPRRPAATLYRAEVEATAKRFPGSGPLTLALGYYALADQDLDSAHAVASRFCMRRPSDPDARLLLGFVYLRQKRFAVARAQLSAVLALSPRHRVARALLSTIDVVQSHSLVTEKDLAGAQRVLRKSTPGRRNRRAMGLASARLELAKGDLDAARGAFDELGMGGESELLGLAAELEQALADRSIEKALEVAREMCARRPESPLAQHERGRIALSLGEEEEGLGALREALRLAPSWSVALASLYRGLDELGHGAEAVAVLESRLTKSPDDPHALTLLAERKLATGDPLAAKALAERSIGIDGAPRTARSVILRAILTTQGAPAALARAEEWLLEDEPHADLLSMTGQAALAAADPDRAESLFRRALALDSDLLEAHVGMAEAMILRSRGDSALLHAGRAATLAPDLVATRFLYASLLDQRGRTAEAGAEYEATLVLDPDHPFALANLALVVARARKDPERADALSKRAVALLPGIPEVQHARGVVLRIAGNLGDAIGHFRKAVEAGGGARMRADLGFALDDSGHPEEARSIYEELTDVADPELRARVRLRLESMK